MNNYLVFSGDQFYPNGGWIDFKRAFDSLDMAMIYLATERFDWYQVVDISTLTIVKQHSKYGKDI